MASLKVHAANLVVASVAVGLAKHCAAVSLFDKEELKKNQVQLYLFAGTFGLCSLMLAYFLEDVYGMHDME